MLIASPNGLSATIVAALRSEEKRRHKMRSDKIHLYGKEYTVFEDGTVIGPSGKVIKQRLNQDGYLVFTAGMSSRNGKSTRSTVFTHRIVAELFVPKPDDPLATEVDHKDGNRANPAAFNLEWVRHQLNVFRAWLRGGYKDHIKGEKNPKARLTESLVMELRRCYHYGDTIMSIARRYKLPWSTVNNAVKGITWSYLPL
jgi:hypothetical protein